MTVEQPDWPSEIRLNSSKDQLRVVFANGDSAALSAEYLRVFSPSAEVQGHAPSERKLVAGKKSVTITGMEPVGNYAVCLKFSDGHDTGLYTWLYLHDLGRKYDELWAQYVSELGQHGLTR